MILFAFPEYQKLASYLLKSSQLKNGQFKLNRFPNQELYITIASDVKGKKCLVLGSIAPPEESLIAVLLLCHTLKKEGAKSITLCLPYIAYARQDKNKPNESLATALVGEILRCGGVDKVVTVDVHSQHVKELFPLPVRSISPTEVFVSEIKKLNFLDASLVAPDKSAYQRSETIKKMARMKAGVVALQKRRNLHGIAHLDLQGEVRSRAVVIDDMLDTGGTLISCCEMLRQKGAKEIVIMVTHGLFTGQKWQQLFNLGVKVIYCTNTVPLDKKLRSNKIKVLAIDQLIAKELGLNEKPRT